MQINFIKEYIGEESGLYSYEKINNLRWNIIESIPKIMKNIGPSYNLIRQNYIIRSDESEY